MVSGQSAIAVIVSLLTGVVATSAPSLRTGEALITVTLLSLGLWGGLYVAAYWLSELVLPPLELFGCYQRV